MFDITAPLERQRTRDGHKVLAIVDSKLDVEYPIAAWFSGTRDSHRITKNGFYYSCESDSEHDIITLPELKTMMVFYSNIYPNGIGPSYPDYESALNSSGGSSIAIIYTVFNPNTGESSIETVWKKKVS